MAGTTNRGLSAEQESNELRYFSDLRVKFVDTTSIAVFDILVLSFAR